MARIDLLWQVRQRLRDEHRVSLRLTDEAGRTWGRRDSEPEGGLRPFSSWGAGEEGWDRHGLLIPAGTPPGTYQIRLGIYGLKDRRGLNVLDENLVPQGTEAILGTVRVRPSTYQPPIEALSIQYPLSVDFASRIRLLGYNVGPGPYKPGQDLALSLFWQGLTAIDENYDLFIQLQDDQGEVWAAQGFRPLGGAYPTSRWPVGQFIRQQYELLIPAEVPGGEYRLWVGLRRPVDGERLKVTRGAQRGSGGVILTRIQVVGRPHIYEAPEVAYPLPASLGEGIRFLGYDLEEQRVKAGGTIRLTLYWQALAEMDVSYTVFVHLLDDDERIRGQRDSIPGQGALPTTGWLRGEYIVDEYEVPIRSDAPTGDYLLEIGMYEATSGVRLPVFGPGGEGLGDRILLEATPIRVLP